MFGAYTHSSFPVYWGASLFKFGVWKSWKHGCGGCCHFDWVCDIINIPGICGIHTVHSVRSQSTLLHSSLVKVTPKPTWLCPKEFEFQARKYVRCEAPTEQLYRSCQWKHAFTQSLHVQVTFSLFVGSPLNCVYVGGIQPELLLLQEWFFQC